MPLALILEDDREIRMLFSEALSVDGFAVMEAPNVREALALLEYSVPDIAFIDINMPGIPGTEVLRHIKTTPRLSSVKTIVVTANALVEENAERLGADLFLVKPVSVHELLTLARRLIQ